MNLTFTWKWLENESWALWFWLGCNIDGATKLKRVHQCSGFQLHFDCFNHKGPPHTQIKQAKCDKPPILQPATPAARPNLRGHQPAAAAQNLDGVESGVVPNLGLLFGRVRASWSKFGRVGASCSEFRRVGASLGELGRFEASLGEVKRVLGNWGELGRAWVSLDDLEWVRI